MMNTTYELLLEKLSRQASNKKIPLNAAFELTPRCNLNCRMCYIHSPQKDCSFIDKELTAQQWIKLASDARDAGLLNLILTGGEIFLREDFENIYEGISKMGLSIILYTNASLIDQEKVKWLGRMPPSSMEITLYGASAQTYDKVCGNAKAYKQVVDAIDMLLAEGINIELKTTVVEDNLDDYAEMAEFSYKRGIPLNIVDYLYPVRSSPSLSNKYRLTPGKLIDFQRRVIDTNQSLHQMYCSKDTAWDLEGSYKYRDKLLRELDNIPPDEQRAESAFGCNAGSSDFWIAWDGRMLPCGSMEEPVFYPLKTGFINAWQKLTKQCSRIPACNECKNCNLLDYCIVCPAKLKCETGHYDRPAPYLCELARRTKEELGNISMENR